MKAIVAAIITCVVIFGLSAGATQYLVNQKTEASGDGEPDGEGARSAGAEEKKLPPQSMPVSFRPESQVSVEAVLQMSDSIKRMEQSVAEREEKVKKDEKRVKMLFDDLATEQDELRAFSEGVEAKIDLLGRMTEELRSTLAALDERKAELEKLEKKASKDGAAVGDGLDERVRLAKGWFDDLPPEQAADYLREFANSGKLDFAAAVLQTMPDRTKSKILGVMDDPVLVDQFLESVNNRKSQP
jgi:hypothetical protein